MDLFLQFYCIKGILGLCIFSTKERLLFSIVLIYMILDSLSVHTLRRLYGRCPYKPGIEIADFVSLYWFVDWLHVYRRFVEPLPIDTE